MKIAVIGTGKTGSSIISLLNKQDIVGPFNTKNLITEEKLKSADVAVVFTSPDALDEIIPILIKAKIPTVIGTTGIELPQNIFETLKKAQITWIQGNNFSLAMKAIKKCLAELGELNQEIPNTEYSIHEIHHKDKVDSPSGTALSWKSWMDLPDHKNIPLTSERIGDEKGTHIFTLTTPYEKITLKHNSLDRKLFAQGAIWACKKLFQDKQIKKGLLLFEDL